MTSQTETYIAAKVAQGSGHSATYFAYYAGRNDAADGLAPERLDDPVLNAHYRKGFKSMKSEMRMDADTEWDA